MLVTKDFVFVHVPKTGGTFLNNLVKEHADVEWEGQFHATYDTLPADYRHLPAIAFVRNPFTWYPSWWEHQRRKGPASHDEWPYRQLVEPSSDFDDFLGRAFAREGGDFYSGIVRDTIAPCIWIGRTERLRSDFTDFLRAHDIDAPDLVDAVQNEPRINVGRCKAPRHYFRTAGTRDLVAQSWAARKYGYSSLRS
jgi:hypothetical protein